MLTTTAEGCRCPSIKSRLDEISNVVQSLEGMRNGPMHGDNDRVKPNSVYIWAGAQAETLVEAM